MMNRLLIPLAIASMMLAACGKGSVIIPEDAYEPKIMIQGVLVPGQVPQVNLRRNFPLNEARIDYGEIPLVDATATITDEAGRVVELHYNPETQAHESAELDVGYGQTYTLSVDATIDGQALHASATTTVPSAGFRILEDQSRLGPMPYRPRDEQGNLINFDVVFERSPGTSYYAVSIVALDASIDNYIYDTPFNTNTSQDVAADFEEYKYNYYWLQDRPLTAGISHTEVLWLYLFFYGRYRITIYGGDKSYRDFQSTHELTQGIDGNFHEPAFHIDGDGIGVFGSAVVATTTLEISRP